MFDMDGKVIGINTAIFSPTGGSVGIGFAIPSNLAEPIIAQLREGGSVERGWLGVMVQEVTPDLAEAIGLDVAEGALVANVVEGGPAEDAGLQQGDVILSFAGTDIAEMRDLPRVVANTQVGNDVEVKLWRDGRTETLEVEVGRMEPQTASLAQPEAQEQEEQLAESLGAKLAAVDRDTADRFDLPAETEGVVVITVEPDSPAAEAGLRPGDLIRRIDNEQVTTVEQVSASLAEAAQGQRSALMLVERAGNPLFLGVKPRA
jgi:serine protease Do